MENLIKIHGSVGTHLSFKMLILSNVFLQNELTYVAKHSPTWLMYQGFWSLNGNPIPVICLQFFFLAFLAWKLFLKVYNNLQNVNIYFTHFWENICIKSEIIVLFIWGNIWNFIVSWWKSLLLKLKTIFFKLYLVLATLQMYWLCFSTRYIQ